MVRTQLARLPCSIHDRVLQQALHLVPLHDRTTVTQHAMPWLALPCFAMTSAATSPQATTSARRQPAWQAQDRQQDQPKNTCLLHIYISLDHQQHQPEDHQRGSQARFHVLEVGRGVQPCIARVHVHLAALLRHDRRGNPALALAAPQARLARGARV